GRRRPLGHAGRVQVDTRVDPVAVREALQVGIAGSAAYEQARNYGLDGRPGRADLDYPRRDQDLGHAEQEDQDEYDGTAPEPDTAGKSVARTDRRVQADWPPRR